MTPISSSLPLSAPPVSKPSYAVRHALHLILLLISAVFLAFHAVHLKADFPNNSPWMDWSKYTDEGWYGDAAIRHFQRGQWYVPGDFNPAAALPVWPLLEAAVFHFTGVSLVAARALTVTIFGLILLTSYLLVSRWMRLASESPKAASAAGATSVDRRLRYAPSPSPNPLYRRKPTARLPIAPALGVLLLAVSPFCFVFTRLAILEPLLVLLALLALLSASYLGPRATLPAILLGLLIPLMILTKTTAVFLLPAVTWLVWARAGYRFRPFLRLVWPPAALAAALWLTYFLAVVRPRFLLDYRYLFSANAYTGITAATALSVFSNTIQDGLWMGKLLFPLALLSILLSVLNPRRTLRNPLVTALLFWAAGYVAFLAYHDNLQPRYYLVIAVPLTLLVPVVFESLCEPAGIHDPLRVSPFPTNSPESQTHPLTAVVLLAVLLVTAGLDARQTLAFVRTPEYTFASAAAKIQQIIAAEHRRNPAHNPLILSISGSNLSLMTGLPSICDDFGTMELPARIQAYHPGWFVTWNQVDDDKMDALSPFYHLQRIAAFPVMDDPERNLLILYRLDAGTSLPSPLHRRKPIPRLLRTTIGQQPSESQLEH